MKLFSALVLSCLVLSFVNAADLVVLTEQNWDQFVPAGKETDAILGDYALKNDRIWVIIAQPLKDRKANMTTKSVGANIIDLTTVENPNDQLTAFFATMRRTYEMPATPAAHGTKVVLTFKAERDDTKPDVTLSYELEDGKNFVTIRSLFENARARTEPANILLDDAYRADDFPADKHPENPGDSFTLYDRWFDQAYTVFADGHTIDAGQPQGKIAQKISYTPTGAKDSKRALKPGEKYELVRHLYPNASALGAKGAALKDRGVAGTVVTFKAVEEGGETASGILLSVSANGRVLGTGRTATGGKMTAFVPAGKYEVAYSGVGYGEAEYKVALVVESGKDTNIDLPLPKAGFVSARVLGEDEKGLPCKVQFKALNGAKDPVFGPVTGSTAVMNLCYTADGTFKQKIDPGEYETLVSYGPEYEIVRGKVKIVAGETAELKATLKRAFKTPGWVSADYHSHSSPSGDNTCDQRGRVLNLLCEHIEYAPCTEHNRIDSYTPHLKALKIEHLMGTCIGMELTGQPLPLNHHNVFPLKMYPRTQDNGGPQNDADPEVQIKRAADWDDKSEKLIQQNHPDIGWLFFDKQGDGSATSGYKNGFPYINVIEVHPIDNILDMKPTHKSMTLATNTTIFNWLQLLNQGYRIPGVVNTDAHQAFHGSGGLRNYVRNDAKIPGEINALDIVRDSKKGHLIMSNAPFMTVKLKDAIPGDDIALPGGKGELFVSVQCASWYDIDRVQVLINGRPVPALNFTRKDNPAMFGTGATRFEQKIPLTLEKDSHVIVVAVGEKKLGDVFGPNWGEQKPAAVSNPIYVDVDGGGFTPNKDTLDAPLPVRSGQARNSR